MINDRGYDLIPARRLAHGQSLWPAGVLAGWRQELVGHPWLVWVGRSCLIAFALVALVSANREAGLLTLGPVWRLTSSLHGPVVVGVAYLLLPAGAAFWLAGQWLLRRARRQPLRLRLGPWPVVLPMGILFALTVLRLSPSIGRADLLFVLAGLGLLLLAYHFVRYGGITGPVLAGGLAVVGCLQAAVGAGQFVLQHDLGLRWLGELPLNPAWPGMSVLGDAGRVLRAYGLMRHPNALGAVLPLSLLAAVSLAQRAGSRTRAVWLAAAALIGVGLLFSFSRSGWLAALVGLAVWLFAQRPSRGAAWAPMLLAAGVVIGAIVALRPELFLGRLAGLLGGGPLLEQRSLLGRLYLLRVAGLLIGHWPWWGVGTQQYVTVAAGLLHIAPAENLLVDSTPLVLWAEQGVVAPLAWLGLGIALVWLGCWRGAAGKASVSRERALATAWVAAIQIVCMFQSFFWPGHQLWQGGIWLGAALGLWARAWEQSAHCGKESLVECGPGARTRS